MTTPAGQTPENRSIGGPLHGLPRAFVILVGAAAAVVVIAGMKAIAWLIGPVFLALIIVISVSPMQSWLRRRGWPGWLTTLMLVLCVFGIMVFLALGIIVSIAQLATVLPQYASTANSLVQSVTNLLDKFGVGADQLKQAASSLDLGKVSGALRSLLGSVAGLVSSLAFLLALLLFLSIESGDARDRLASIATDRPRITEALGHFAWGTRRYLLVNTVFGFIVAVLDSIALAIMNIPLAVTWGLLAFITNYIPNVGFIIGLVPPALLGLLTGGPDLMVAVIVVYGALNFVIQSLIQPRFIGDAVGLSVTVTFVSLVFWAWLLGPLGAILAIPLTLLAKALLVDIDPRARWADALLRSSAKELDEAAQEALAERKKARRRWATGRNRASRRARPARPLTVVDRQRHK